MSSVPLVPAEPTQSLLATQPPVAPVLVQRSVVFSPTRMIRGVAVRVTVTGGGVGVAGRTVTVTDPVSEPPSP